MSHPEPMLPDSSDQASDALTPRETIPAQSLGRRRFLQLAGTTAAATAGLGVSALVSPQRASAAPPRPTATPRATPRSSYVPPAPSNRAAKAHQLRVQAAQMEMALGQNVNHVNNGDEALYPNRIGSYSKALPHNALGEVDAAAYTAFLKATQTGKPADFAAIPLGGTTKLTNPQCGLAFVMQGPDAGCMVQAPPPAFASAEIAAEIAENYWMALLRDTHFEDYATSPLAAAAAADESTFSNFKGPKQGGSVTPQTLFRGLTAGDLTGPYISQFMWLETPFGAERVDRRMRTMLPGTDNMTTYAEWLAIQRGAAPSAAPQYDPVWRYIRNGRDLSEWVHIDVLFQAYFNAMLVIMSLGLAVDDEGNPYTESANQAGFCTLGPPYIASVLCAVTKSALAAVWHQKWFVHRRLRPEAFGGRIHNHVTGAANYPIHSEILNSPVLDEVYDRNGTYLLPMAFVEGCPTHPAYGAGHATVAGACTTILKAFFKESLVIPNPVVASPDGTALLPYTGPALTIGGELNKIASNVAIGRNIAGVHWRSDATASLTLGEEIAIRYLREEKMGYNEPFDGWKLTKFDGTTVTV